MLEIFPKYFQKIVCKFVLDDFNYGRLEGSIEFSPVSISDDYQLCISDLQGLKDIKKECVLFERKFKLEVLLKKTEKSTFKQYFSRFFTKT